MRYRKAFGTERQGTTGLLALRWGSDDGAFDVLYTSETRQAAIEERRFQLLQGQPIPPSKVRYELFELRISLEAVIRFQTLNHLSALQLDIQSYGKLSFPGQSKEYPRSQEIAEACSFLGADGILVPRARTSDSKKLVASTLLFVLLANGPL